MSAVTTEINVLPAKAAVEVNRMEDLQLRIRELCLVLGSYLEPGQVALVREACHFAAEAHVGQRRKSGEPYIFHPLAVARVLADVRFDHETIMGAILHDVIEDTGCSKEQLSHRFGDEVAELVDGVSKLTQMKLTPNWKPKPRTFARCFSPWPGISG